MAAYTDDELRGFYRGAKDGEYQIRILCDLSGKSENEIRRILGLPEENKMKKIKWSEDDVKTLSELLDAGWTPEGIAEHFGRTISSVESKINKEKYKKTEYISATETELLPDEISANATEPTAEPEAAPVYELDADSVEDDTLTEDMNETTAPPCNELCLTLGDINVSIYGADCFSISFATVKNGIRYSVDISTEEWNNDV